MSEAWREARRNIVLATGMFLAGTIAGYFLRHTSLVEWQVRTTCGDCIEKLERLREAVKP